VYEEKMREATRDSSNGFAWCTCTKEQPAAGAGTNREKEFSTENAVKAKKKFDAEAVN
jgi:hypothetical protein